MTGRTGRTGFHPGDHPLGRPWEEDEGGLEGARTSGVTLGHTVGTSGVPGGSLGGQGTGLIWGQEEILLSVFTESFEGLVSLFSIIDIALMVEEIC
jgi:hypothetical protein